MSRLILSILLAVFVAGCGVKANKEAADPNIIAGDLYARGSALNTYSKEVVMDFDYFVFVTEDQFEDTRSFATMKEVFEDKIYDQIQHLFGSLKVGKLQGVPKLGPGQKITIDASSLQYDKDNGEYVVKYHYTGRALLDDGFGDVTKLALPRNPDYIYSQSKRNYNVNPCTDDHYNSEGDFWYYWNATKCPLITNGVEFDYVSVKLTKLPSTTKTYPEFDRLVRSAGQGKKKMTIYAFYGTVEEASMLNKDLSNNSVLKKTFNETNDTFTKQGFTITNLTRLADAALLYEYEKNIPQSNLNITIKVYYGNTGIEEKDVIEFYKLYKEGLEKGSVLFYGGHSGLGGNLDLEMIEENVGKIRFAVNDYQIMFFDSCSSFPYYTQMYFSKKVTAKDKVGSKNLDIITNGLSSYFVRNNASIATLMTVINSAYEENKIYSWQEAIDYMHATQMAIEPSLSGHLLALSGLMTTVGLPFSFRSLSLFPVEYNN